MVERLFYTQNVKVSNECRYILIVNCCRLARVFLEVCERKNVKLNPGKSLSQS